MDLMNIGLFMMVKTDIRSKLCPKISPYFRYLKTPKWEDYSSKIGAPAEKLCKKAPKKFEVCSFTGKDIKSNSMAAEYGCGNSLAVSTRHKNYMIGVDQRLSMKNAKTKCISIGGKLAQLNLKSLVAIGHATKKLMEFIPTHLWVDDGSEFGIPHEGECPCLREFWGRTPHEPTFTDCQRELYYLCDMTEKSSQTGSSQNEAVIPESIVPSDKYYSQIIATESHHSTILKLGPQRFVRICWEKVRWDSAAKKCEEQGETLALDFDHDMFHDAILDYDKKRGDDKMSYTSGYWVDIGGGRTHVGYQGIDLFSAMCPSVIRGFQHHNAHVGDFLRGLCEEKRYAVCDVRSRPISNYRIDAPYFCGKSPHPGSLAINAAGRKYIIGIDNLINSRDAENKCKSIGGQLAEKIPERLEAIEAEIKKYREIVPPKMWIAGDRTADSTECPTLEEVFGEAKYKLSSELCHSELMPNRKLHYLCDITDGIGHGSAEAQKGEDIWLTTTTTNLISASIVAITIIIIISILAMAFEKHKSQVQAISRKISHMTVKRQKEAISRKISYITVESQEEAITHKESNMTVESELQAISYKDSDMTMGSQVQAIRRKDSNMTVESLD